MNDCDLSIHYHSGKADMVADVPSRKSGGSLAILITKQSELLRNLEEMQIEVNLNGSTKSMNQLNQMGVKFGSYDKIKEAQQKI